jgi:hypothetical protein
MCRWRVYPVTTLAVAGDPDAIVMDPDVIVMDPDAVVMDPDAIVVGYATERALKFVSNFSNLSNHERPKGRQSAGCSERPAPPIPERPETALPDPFCPPLGYTSRYLAQMSQAHSDR